MNIYKYKNIKLKYNKTMNANEILAFRIITCYLFFVMIFIYRQKENIREKKKLS